MADVSRENSYLTPGQAARILGVSPKTVNRWANLDRIPCAVTLGGHRRFRADVIAAASASMGINDSHQPGEPS
jgi:excisionase family DNA binding protein